jgi:hypothetical protein
MIVMPNLVAVQESPTTYDAVAHRFVNPQGKLFLLYGDPIVFRFSISLASYALLSGSPIAVVDGCNRFDAHNIARFAREHEIDPGTLLNRIYVSRGFTCYQMEAAINDRLMPFLERIQGNTALIFGLLDTFYDEQAPMREVRQMLRRVVDKLQEMKSHNISLLLASQAWNVSPLERNQLLATLKSSMDGVYRVELNEDGKPKLFLEHHRRIHGTNRSDLHESHRFGAGKLVKVPPRTAQGGPGSVR